MDNKSLIWIWGLAAVMCFVNGFLKQSPVWFVAAAMSLLNAIKWAWRIYHK